MTNLTLGQLLEEIKLGKEAAEELKTSEQIQDLIEEDFGFFMTSKRINNLLKQEAELLEETLCKKLLKISKRFEEYEDRLLEGKTPSVPYLRMKADAIYEDLNEAYDIIASNPKNAKKFNKNSFKQIFGAAEYGYSKLTEDAKIKTRKFKEIPNFYANYISKEKELISEAVI